MTSLYTKTHRKLHVKPHFNSCCYLSHGWYLSLMRQGSSSIALMLAITLFCSLIIIFSQWYSTQQQHSVYLYQREQALLIAENQAYRQHFGLTCQTQHQQNGITFTIQCQSGQIIVDFPLGSMALKMDE